MLAMWVKVRVKPGERERFLKAIEVDLSRANRRGLTARLSCSQQAKVA
jgi:hypothetical protein